MRFALSAPSASAITLLGVDPGLRHTGYGVIRIEGQRLIAVDWGVITPKIGADDENSDHRISQAPLAERLGQIASGLAQVVHDHQPHQAAVEIVFVNVNPQSTLLLGQARGAAITALVQAKLPVLELTALQIKQGIVGNGRATKAQVRYMVKTLLNIPEITPMAFDAADALACALAAHFQMRAKQIEPRASLSPSSTSANNEQLRAFRAQTQRKRGTKRWSVIPARPVKK